MKEGMALNYWLHFIQVLVYRKTLRLAANVLPSSGMSLGLAANLISVDVYNVMMAFYMGHYVWALPLMVTSMEEIYALIPGLLCSAFSAQKRSSVY